MSGQERALPARLLRGAMSAAEPIYSAAVSRRNRRFDEGVGVRRLPRQVISVGNITAGGTGKTPVVRWLAGRLREAGRHPAILLRGYKSKDGLSDEQRMLDVSLNSPGQPRIIVQANPDRFDGGGDVLRDHPDVDVFVLDDGFQHRKLARDFDLVLISATHPFGFNHVHPRGLLREPLASLRRASALLITRANEVDRQALAEIEGTLREHQPTASIYHADHAQIMVRGVDGTYGVEGLAGKRVFAFCGLGNPESFFGQLATRCTLVGRRAFADHHAYSLAEIAALDEAARSAKADLLIATEKDWAKLEHFLCTPYDKTPIHCVEMAIRFHDDDERRLLAQVGVARGA